MFVIAPSAELVDLHLNTAQSSEPALTDSCGANINFLSPERVEVAATRSWLPPRELSLLLDGKPTDVRLRVENWTQGPGVSRMGRLAPLPLEEARTVIRLSQSVRRRPAGVFALERVTDAARIRRTLTGLANARVDGVVLGSTPQLTVSLLACLAPPHKGLMFLTSGELPSGSSIELELVGPLSLFRMGVRVTHSAPGYICTELPQDILRTRRRKWLRSELSGTHLMVRHPWFENDLIRMDARDASYGGLGLSGEIESLLLYPGLRLPEIELWRGDRRVDGPYRAEVKHAAQAGAGATLYAADRAPTSSWLAYPRTTLDPTPVSEVWNLLVESGYLSLAGRSPQELSTARSTYLDTLQHLHEAPSVGVVAGWRSPKGFDGVVTMVRLYESVWMAYHLAKVSGPSASGMPGKLVLRDFLRHAHEHVMSQDNTRYLLSYVRDDAGWPKLLNVEFAQRNAAEGHCFIEREHAYLVPCAEPAADSGAVLAFDAPGTFLAAARQRHGAAFCDAYDYGPEDLTLTAVSGRWRDAGLQRQRALFQCNDANGACAFAVAELASPGTHLYGLFDCVRIYHAAAHCARAERALLEAAARWFRSAQRSEFVFLQQDGLPAPLRSAQDMGRFSASLIPIAIAPDYMEHLWEITSTQVRV